MDPRPVPNTSWIKVNKVARSPATDKLSAEAPEISWPTIPLDILKLLIEESPIETLRNWCLVSRFCNGFATPVLYRHVHLLLQERSGPEVAAALKRFIKGAGKYCRTLRIEVMHEVYYTDYWEPPDFELPLDALMNVLCMSSKGMDAGRWKMEGKVDLWIVELAIETMPRLELFR
jgi:hypothetical protein